jgi:hypothetical protein
VLFATPPIDEVEAKVLGEIDGLWQTLRYQVAGQRRWVGTLRRVSFARALQGSNSIEGFNVTLDDAVAAADAEAPLDAEGETWEAVLGCRDAMTYVVQIADDPYFSYSEALIRRAIFIMAFRRSGTFPTRPLSGSPLGTWPAAHDTRSPTPSTA